MEFITCKDDTTKITNFNISVAVTDAFMAAVEADGEYDLIHPKTGKVTGQLNAREVWERIIHGAWKTGEPGVFFIDRANYYNPVPHLGALRGHQSLRRAAAPAVRRLQPRLDQPRRVRQGRRDRLGRACAGWCTSRPTSSRTSSTPTSTRCPEITELAQRIRRIGLGVMGLADLFVKLGIPYDSEEGVALGRQIQQFVDEEAKVESERLAGERGVFAEWERSIWGPDETCGPGCQGRADPARCGGSGTATSPRWRRPAPSRSSPAAARASSRSSPSPSCGTRPAC